MSVWCNVRRDGLAYEVFELAVEVAKRQGAVHGALAAAIVGEDLKGGDEETNAFDETGTWTYVFF